MTRLAGHALANEGAAFTSTYSCPDCGLDAPTRARAQPGNGTAGDGHALCSCGAESPHLPSGKTRKKWHHAHKREVIRG